ncbi:MAG: polysaccharide biosynthesis/export family protein [Bacteroidota bacterium]
MNFQAPIGMDTVSTDVTNRENYIAIIQPGDLLNIYVASSSAEASKYFNFSERPEDQNSMANAYLVDDEGNVHLPMIGDMKVVGLTSGAARDTLTRRLEKYLVNPSVKLTIRNFRVTVIGEVARPGVVSVVNERISLPEALAMVGDLTIYSRRDNIMVIRDHDGKKEYGVVNLESRELFNSDFYWLHANDIVYIEPMKTKKTMAETWYRVLPIIFSGVSLALAILAVVK